MRRQLNKYGEKDMTTSINFYCRRVVKVQKGNQILHVLSGQWVGHKNYGSDFGTERQRNLLLKNCGGEKILAISENIFWNVNGYSGEVLANDNPLVSKAKF